MSDYHSDIGKILNDKTSGSRELLQKVIKFINENSTLISSEPEYLLKLKNGLNKFETIREYLGKVESAKSIEEIESLSDTYISEESNVYERLYNNAKPFIAQDNSFITISNSLTILEIFKKLRSLNDKIMVTVCESRPINEGVIMAELLAENNIEVRLITEAQIGFNMEKIDCVIISADRVLPNGNIVNKTGSLTLALCAKAMNKPFYVLADKSKFGKDHSFIPDTQPPSEIYSGGNSMIVVTNNYFEEVNKTYITKIITD